MKGAAAGVAVALLVAACVFPVADTGTGAGASPWVLSCIGARPYGGVPLHAALPPSYFVASVGAATSVPADLAALLDKALADLLRKTGVPAITAALDLAGAGQWSRTLGLARTGSVEQVATPTTLFHWGSVAHLLTHTSGLATDALDGQGQTPPSLAELVRAAARTPSVACPGAAASYSNTGYLMLGLVVQAVTGEPFDQALHHRIVQTLGLQHLRALRLDEEVAHDLAKSRLLAPATVQQQWVLLYPMVNSTPVAANTATMWFAQWQDEQGRSRVWLAHLGGTGGSNAVVVCDLLAQTYAAVAVNSEVLSVAVANVLYSTLAWRAKESSARREVSMQMPPSSPL